MDSFTGIIFTVSVDVHVSGEKYEDDGGGDGLCRSAGY